MTPPDSKSIYARGADCGLWLGLCFIAMFVLAAASMRMPLLNIGVIGIAVYVPVLSYRFLRRTHVDAHGLTSFSALWMQGIVMFACGALLLGAAAYLYIKVVEPNFISNVVKFGIEYYSSAGTPEADAIADEFRKIVELNRLPRTGDVVLMYIWATVFSGSILSMLLAVIARARRVPLPEQDTNNIFR